MFNNVLRCPTMFNNVQHYLAISSNIFTYIITHARNSVAVHFSGAVALWRLLRIFPRKGRTKLSMGFIEEAQRSHHLPILPARQIWTKHWIHMESLSLGRVKSLEVLSRDDMIHDSWLSNFSDLFCPYHSPAILALFRTAAEEGRAQASWLRCSVAASERMLHASSAIELDF